MALDFNKINRVAAFNPTTAFPLDARSYFESYESAVLAASLAKEAGDTTTTYYYGQTLVVVENNLAKLYIIQPDNTLQEASGKIVVDENAFTIDENGILWLEGFVDAEIGAQLVKGADGKLSWIVPDSNTIEGLNTTVEALKTDVKDLSDIIGIPSSETAEASGLFKELDAKANINDVYTKNETDIAISTAVSNAAHLKRKIVENEEAILKYANEHNDAEQYIFMIPTGLKYDANKYYEYIVLKSIDVETEVISYTIEKIGSWDIDLTDYAKKSDILVKSVNTTFFSVDNSGELVLNNLSINQIEGLEESLNKKVEVKEGFGLVSLSEIEKLLTISENAEENFVKQVDNANFTVDETGKLLLNEININKITGLDDLLNNESTGLISRLNTVEVTVSNNSSDIESILSLLNGDEGLSNIVEGLNKQIIELDKTVNSHSTTISGLEETVANNSNSILTLQNEIKTIQNDINNLDNNYVTKSTYLGEVGNYNALSHLVAEDSTLVDEVNNLIDALTWKTLSENA